MNTTNSISSTPPAAVPASAPATPTYTREMVEKITDFRHRLLNGQGISREDIKLAVEALRQDRRFAAAAATEKKASKRGKPKKPNPYAGITLAEL